MNIAAIGAVACLVSCSGQGTARAPLNEWPRLTRYVEAGIALGNGAFVGTLEFFDVHKRNANVTEVSCRILPGETIWGDPLDVSIDLGRSVLLMHGGSDGAQLFWWSFAFDLDKGLRSFPVLVVHQTEGEQTQILHIIRGQVEGAPRARDSFLTIVRFERGEQGNARTQALDEAATASESSEAVWSYALRELADLDEDPSRRFDTVFSKRLQNTQSARRLWYAAQLLTCNDRTEERVPNPADARIVRARFLGVFEDATNAEVAYAALMALLDIHSDKRVPWDPEDFAQGQRRIAVASNDPTHPIHRLDADRSKTVENILEKHFDVHTRLGRARQDAGEEE